MAKLISMFLFVFIFPLAAHAAWWNPFSWGKQEVIIVPATSIPTSTTTTTPESKLESIATGPNVEELNKRIAELENKLEDAYAKIRAFSKNEAVKIISTSKATTTNTVAPSAGLSSKEVSAKAKAATVLVQTATTSESGIIISPSGNVLLNAHSVWMIEDGKVATVTPVVSVTLSSGAKKKAELLGFDEANDIAVYSLSDRTTYAYLKPVYDSNIKAEDAVYVSSYPSTLISGTVSKKASTFFELNTESKPADDGGAILNASGEFLGIPNKSSCKVLEEQKNCLKYTISSNAIKTVMPKLLAGMKLYKEKKYRTAEEKLARGLVEGVYGNTLDNSVIQYAISNVTGGNSFDYLTEKLSANDDVKMKKLYLNKLKGGADYIHKAVDFLKGQAYNLNLSFINESTALEKLEPYQQKILGELRAFNSAKLKEYQGKVDYWTAKKNEYDKWLVDPASAKVDYLMEQGIFIEKSTEYLVSERRKILDMFSGENLNIF
jgi:S1-C subfamily serine protease